MKEKERKEGVKNNNFDNVMEKMKQLENTINEGFEKVLEINPVKVTQEQVKNSFADTVKMSNKVIIPEFRKVLLDEKIKEFEEEQQKDLRMTNIIIFGHKENDEDDDQSFVKSLIVDAGWRVEWNWNQIHYTNRREIRQKNSPYQTCISVSFPPCHADEEIKEP